MIPEGARAPRSANSTCFTNPMRSSRILALDAGAGHVAGGVFTSGARGKLLLEEFALETRTSDPSLEPGWMERTAQALASVAAQRSLRGNVALAVPGHLALTKFIKTPAVLPAQRDKVIQFEAAQNIPYPLDAVAWDHLQVAGDDLDIEIMLTAVKLELMENLCAAADAAGFPVRRAAASCFALYHAFRVNYPEVAAPALVVDIGARSTNLLLVGPGGRFFARTFALAGSAITAAVAEELQLDFARAEELKIQVSAGDASLPDDSPAAAAVRRAVENFSIRLQQEITRTVGNYSWRTGGGAPIAIYLSGGGSLMSGLAQSLAAKFKVPVERYDPLRNIELSDRARAAGAQAATHVLANLVGMARLGATEAGAASRLLPPARRAAHEFRRCQPLLLGALALVALALLPPLAHFHRLAAAETARSAEFAAQVPRMRALADRNAVNLGKIAAAQKEVATLRALVEVKSSWISFLADLQSRLAKVEDVWLEQLAVMHPPAAVGVAGVSDPATAAPTQHLLLSGRLLDIRNPASKVSPDSYERVKQLFASFAGSRFVAAVENERFDNSQPGLLRFDVTLVVNPQHPL